MSATPTATRFDCMVLRTTDGARAEITPHGAQVLHWTTARDASNRLYLSPGAQYHAGAAIRGGIPVLFPQFGLFGPLPKHGLVRTRQWAVDATAPDRVRLVLRDDDASRARWPHAFQLALTISLAASSLTLALEIGNTGTSPFTFTAGLHGYFAVADVQASALAGLSGLEYLDATRGLARHREHAGTLTVDGEIDRVYLAAGTPLTLRDGVRATRFTQRGFSDVVVWNPGPQARLPDLPAGEHRRMICVEAAQIAEPVTLVPGGRWHGTQALQALEPA